MVGGRPARLPDAVRVYAIGDVHGRLDLLRKLEAQIEADIAARDDGARPLLVYLGDYVDRGFESMGVIEHLCGPALDGCDRVLLLGNHDAWMRDFLDGQPVGPNWLRFGGDATLLSYGVRVDFKQPEEARIAAAQTSLVERVPAHHRTFLAELELAFALGDYFFCHAGIRPGLALEEQGELDLIWIREPFLGWEGECGKVIVHGHTVEDEPVVRHNRIGVDTGACFTGRLTCLVLEGDEFRFLDTAPGPQPD
ncbi:MAG: serine/threonine protein phosphatase [Geminicoccaceae bacterium]|nr:serine/threonine protein phosphatase [Geminicoccaceae bacterium]